MERMGRAISGRLWHDTPLARIHFFSFAMSKAYPWPRRLQAFRFVPDKGWFQIGNQCDDLVHLASHSFTATSQPLR
jgi:hypothetical protein